LDQLLRQVVEEVAQKRHPQLQRHQVVLVVVVDMVNQVLLQVLLVKGLLVVQVRLLMDVAEVAVLVLLVLLVVSMVVMAEQGQYPL
jgi:hypothetical protein